MGGSALLGPEGDGSQVEEGLVTPRVQEIKLLDYNKAKSGFYGYQGLVLIPVHPGNTYPK